MKRRQKREGATGLAGTGGLLFFALLPYAVPDLPCEVLYPGLAVSGTAMVVGWGLLVRDWRSGSDDPPQMRPPPAEPSRIFRARGGQRIGVTGTGVEPTARFSMRDAIIAAERTKLAGFLGKAYVDGYNLFQLSPGSEAEYADWKKAVSEWRSGTEALIREHMQEWDVTDFLDTTNLMAADITGRVKFGQEHNDMLLTLERRLSNLKALREKVEHGP